MSNSNYAISQLKVLLGELQVPIFSEPLPLLEGSSIGQHIRHIVEFYQCLLVGCGTGFIDYDTRPRDLRIEQNPALALSILIDVLVSLEGFKPEQTITLISDNQQIATSIGREMHYLAEHTVHHLATVRLALKTYAPEMSIPVNFGIAKATAAYREQAK